jgi:hypothetical protein
MKSKKVQECSITNQMKSISEISRIIFEMATDSIITKTAILTKDISKTTKEMDSASTHQSRKVFTKETGKRTFGILKCYHKLISSDGKGKYSWVHGDYYIGDFKQHKRDGYGIYVWPSKDRYEGSFKDNLKDGHGINKENNLG